MVVVGKSSATLPVNEIMTPESKLMTVVPQQSVLDVMKLMMKYNFRHVPVVRFRAPALPRSQSHGSPACISNCVAGKRHRWTARNTWA